MTLARPRFRVEQLLAVVCVAAATSAMVTAADAGAQAAVAPPPAIEAARAAMGDTAVGAGLRVVLLTAGPGEQVWERFGHNLLWVHDQATGESVAWNWGLFDFDEPGFYRRFLFGATRYWMEGHDVAAVLAMYQRLGREVVAQELALDAGQRAALAALVRVNALQENRFYRYDYYLDNCSTRLRDALDIALGGALRAALERVPMNGITYRSESLRLVQHSAPLVLGMDIALGRRADVPLNAWEAAFIPMRLRDAIREVTVERADGTVAPLVVREYVAVPGSEAADLVELAVARDVRVVSLSALLLATLILGCGVLARRGSRPARAVAVALGVAVHALFGLVAMALVFMWLFTRHDFWDWNGHLLLMTPLSLVVALRLPRAALPRNGWLRPYHIAMTVLSLAMLVVGAIGLRGPSAPTAALAVAWAQAAWVLYASVFVALLMGMHGPPVGPSPEPAAMRAAA